MPKDRIIHCKKCGMPLVEGTRICSYCNRKTGVKVRNGSSSSAKFGISIGDRRFPIPWVSAFILLLNVAAGIYEIIAGERTVAESYAMQQGLIQAGQWYCVFTSSFLHFGFPHFATNMLSLIIYGFAFENHISRWKYLLIYIAGIIGSGLLVNFTGGYGLHAGASGALWALMTGAFVWRLRNNDNPLLALYGIVSSLYYTFGHFNISWQGHLGGGIAGFLIALLLFRKEK